MRSPRYRFMLRTHQRARAESRRVHRRPACRAQRIAATEIVRACAPPEGEQSIAAHALRPGEAPSPRVQLAGVERLAGSSRTATWATLGTASLSSSSRLPAEPSGKVCNAGDVAAGTGKAFNEARRDRIDPAAYHNDGNRSWPHSWPRGSARPLLLLTDDINLETGPVSAGRVEAVASGFPSAYRHSVARFCPSDVATVCAERADSPRHGRSQQPGRATMNSLSARLSSAAGPELESSERRAVAT